MSQTTGQNKIIESSYNTTTPHNVYGLKIEEFLQNDAWVKMCYLRIEDHVFVLSVAALLYSTLSIVFRYSDNLFFGDLDSDFHFELLKTHLALGIGDLGHGLKLLGLDRDLMTHNNTVILSIITFV